MNSISLAILGAGNIENSPAILGALGSYYGERPLDITLFDADVERLDLFDRLARVILADSNVEHKVRSTVDPEEAASGASRVVLQFDGNCAQKYAKQRGKVIEGDGVEFLASEIVPHLADEALVLSLLPADVAVGLSTYYRLSWLPPLEGDSMLAVPLQVMRWIRREEPIYQLIDAHERSPFKKWLDEPTTADLVVGLNS